ncbi:hypothetical protein HMPREF3224_01281 [Anaerococcus hydrogenalis]|nr:hypothetical protein HMPREF3224_01281 [Anaerococcus hydrogenalis]
MKLLKKLIYVNKLNQIRKFIIKNKFKNLYIKSKISIYIITRFKFNVRHYKYLTYIKVG